MNLRSPIFTMLDEMIVAGYGDVSQIDIPENWREIPREVHQQDLDRIRVEEFGKRITGVREIELANRLSRIDFSLTEQVLENQRTRRSLGVRRGPYESSGVRRSSGSGRRRPTSNRPWSQRVAWREAAMRARVGRRKSA